MSEEEVLNWSVQVYFQIESNTYMKIEIFPARNKYQHVNHVSYEKCARTLRPGGEIIVELERTSVFPDRIKKIHENVNISSQEQIRTRVEN